MLSFIPVIDIMDTHLVNFLDMNKVLISMCIISLLTYYGGVFDVKLEYLLYLLIVLSCLFWKKFSQMLKCFHGYEEARPIGDERFKEFKSSKDIKDINADSVLPEVPDPPKRNKRRGKRRGVNKSKYKAMDDASETSSNSSEMSSRSDITDKAEKTKIYSRLAILDDLKIDRNALYYEFQRYILTKEQLSINGFPEQSPENPDRAVFKYPKVERGSTRRHCCRCTSVFHVFPDGEYEAKGPCHYHLKKQVPFRAGHPYYGDFPCCNGNYLSKGCQTWQYHVTQESALEDVKFVKTKLKKHLTKAKAGTIFALDCEMLFTTAGMEVAKVGIVGIDGLTIYETFVLPQNPILDYNTTYSGVSENDLKDVSVTLFDVQTYLLKILNKDSILVGHGLENDLKALRLIHDKVVDTSVVFPHPHNRRHKKSLRNLAQEFLDKQIQQSHNGHNCIEDARTCMELMLLKISGDLKERSTQDENRNSILQNMNQPGVFKPSPKYALYTTSPYSYVDYSWSHRRSCGYITTSDAFYSGLLTPKNHPTYIY